MYVCVKTCFTQLYTIKFRSEKQTREVNMHKMKFKSNSKALYKIAYKNVIWYLDQKAAKKDVAYRRVCTYTYMRWYLR